MKKGKTILGINSVYHESSACLIQNGQITAAAEEERFNRIKHAKPAEIANGGNPHILPWNAINFCIDQAGINPQEVDYIGYSFMPIKRLKNIFTKEGKKLNDCGTLKAELKYYWNLQKIPQELKKTFKKAKFKWIDHHLCHAASSFFVSPFEESAVLAIDGIAEFDTVWLGLGKKNKLYNLKKMSYPNSLGFLWEKMAKFLGFTEYDACKVMGLTAYGNPETFCQAFKKFVAVGKGDFKINNQIVKFRVDDYSELEKLFGPKKEKNKPITDRHKDIAAALQKITEEILLELANWLFIKTDSSNLCIAGGVGLNCVANTVIQTKTSFNNLYIQPAAFDSGTSLGAAFYIWHQLLGNPRSYIMEHPYLGPAYSESEIKQALKKYSLNYTYEKDVEKLTAQYLAKGKVIAWFQGKMGFGPRALGHRSIVVDPRDPKMTECLNSKVKYREWFRPYAPSVLEEEASQWFELPSNKSLSQRFMLFAYPVKKEKQTQVPAITHIDGTSRIQIVSKKVTPKYYKLIQEFAKITGVPLVLNTSFNIQEPIVNNPEDAIKTFLKGNIDVLVMGNYLIKK